MSLLYVNDEEAAKKINIDELYERKHQRDLKQIGIFNKLLNRIHKRINYTSRIRKHEKYVWFQVPEFIFGEPNYDNSECLGYLVAKLEENGFYTRYMHPNSLFISWENWVPSYTRNELKKKTGIVMDEKGNIIERLGEQTDEEKAQQEGNGNNSSSKTKVGKDGREYTSIDQYKPTGKLVYSPDMLEKVERKVNFQL